MSSQEEIFICLIGLSGAGKTTLAQEVYRRNPAQVYLPISTTTRESRPGERGSLDYHFVTREEFELEERSGNFLETAEYNGHKYGTHRKELKEGKTIIHVVEEQGAQKLKEKAGAIIVLVVPPSEEVLLKRLMDRGDEQHLVERLRFDARRRNALQPLADYTIINDDLERALVELDNYVKLRREFRRIGS